MGVAGARAIQAGSHPIVYNVDGHPVTKGSVVLSSLA